MVDDHHDVVLHRELLLRIAKGDLSAFSRLYDLLSKPLASLAYRILGDAEEVEEVLQDVFVVVWNKAGTYDPTISRPFSWLIVITRRLCWNRLRTRGRHQRKIQALQDEGGGPVVPVSEKMPNSRSEVNEFVEQVREQLDQFPEQQEKVIEMALFDGFTQQEIAGVMDLPLGTVKTWIRRGMMKIRQELEANI